MLQIIYLVFPKTLGCRSYFFFQINHMFFLHQLIDHIILCKKVKIRLPKTKCFSKYFVVYVKILYLSSLMTQKVLYKKILYCNVLKDSRDKLQKYTLK